MTGKTKNRHIRLSSLSVIMLILGTIYFPLDFVIAEEEFQITKTLDGMVYSPYVDDSDSLTNHIDNDLNTISKITSNIRTYQNFDNIEQILESAERYNLNVYVGIEISDEDAKENIAKIDQIISYTKKFPNTIQSIIINDNTPINNQEIKDLISYLIYTKEKVNSSDVLISSGNNFDVWNQYPSLVQHVDYIMFNSFDYWNGFSIYNGMKNTIEQHDKLQQKYPNKHVIIETGWSTDGRHTLDIKNMNDNNSFIQTLKKAHSTSDNPLETKYFVFDESWKSSKLENNVEKHYGLFGNDELVKQKISSIIKPNLTYTIQPDIRLENNKLVYKIPHEIISDNEEKILEIDIDQTSSFDMILYKENNKELFEITGSSTIFVEDYNDVYFEILPHDKQADLDVTFTVIPKAYGKNLHDNDLKIMTWYVNSPLNNDTEIPLFVIVIIALIGTMLLFGIMKITKSSSGKYRIVKYHPNDEWVELKYKKIEHK